MIETDITMPTNFDQTNFFIMSPNPTVTTNIVGAMSSSS